MVSHFPRPIREIMTQWIPMPDGIRLAARIWLPLDAEADPVPAVLEYLPYRRRDGTAARDAITQPYIAGHGYAAVRVDVRGTGDSGGIITDEYDLPELADGEAIVAWLAEQPWCNGNVGMWGISWGGFNALQVASRAPAALKAIIPIGFTHDRYDGDCHFMGGCLLEGNISWGHTFLSQTARPPDPHVVGPGWRDQWLARLEALEHPIATWLSHQRRDDYWKPGSVCEDFSRITAAVYAVSGWQDSYSRNVLPLVGNLSCPWKALIGPWAHSWPHIATPGPTIGFLQEALRWWDHWLKGIDTGIMDEPRLRVWMGDWTPPRKWVPAWPGRWVSPCWPPGQTLTLPLGSFGETRVIASPETLGATAGYQNSYGLGPDLSDDQQPDDALSCCFDFAEHIGNIEIFGEPTLSLILASDRPQAMLAARLCDVAPDGSSLRLSYALLNLSHRDGHAAPQPMVPGEQVRVRLVFAALAHRLARGHRLRLALSTAYWPIAWPSPEPAEFTLHLPACSLALPLHPQSEDVLVPFGGPEGATPSAISMLRPIPADRPQDSISTDAATGEQVIRRERDRGAWRCEDTDVSIDSTGVLQFAVTPGDPLSARQDFHLTTEIGREGWRTRSIAHSRLSATATDFILTSRLEAFEDDTLVFARDWRLLIPRDNV